MVSENLFEMGFDEWEGLQIGEMFALAGDKGLNLEK